jgi:predicted nucleic acid-binding Zn ribbon protein
MSPRADEPSGIGAVIQQILGTPRLRQGLALGRLSRAWEDVAGEALAKQTEPVSLDEAGLVVGASSPAWGAQVRFLAEDIRRKASEALDGLPVGPVRVVVRDDRQNRRSKRVF